MRNVTISMRTISFLYNFISKGLDLEFKQYKIILDFENSKTCERSWLENILYILKFEYPKWLFHFAF